MKILVLPGDGIGPEITAATLTVLDRVNERFKLGLEWQKDEIGLASLKSEGTTLPPRANQRVEMAPAVSEPKPPKSNGMPASAADSILTVISGLSEPSSKSDSHFMKALDFISVPRTSLR